MCWNTGQEHPEITGAEGAGARAGVAVWARGFRGGRPAEVLPRWAGVSGRHGDVGPGFVHGRGMATHPLKTQGIGNAADCWENWDYAKDRGRSVAGEAVPPPPGALSAGPPRPPRLVALAQCSRYFLHLRARGK